MTTYICAFIGSAILAIFWTPVVIRLGHRYKVLDQPGLRKIHNSPIPRLGGVAIALPIMVMVALVCALDNEIGGRFQSQWMEITALLAGSSVMLLVGLADDLRSVRARHKLLAQLITATIACALGIRLDSMNLGPIGTIELGIWTWPITVFWIAGMTNAVNLIDGLDGLAAGIASITVFVIAIVAFTLGQTVMTTLMLICLGVLAGYLIFNFNPARIFCGDSGTYFLGFFIGASSLITSTKQGALIGLTVPLLSMGIPIFDTFFAIVRRALERKSLFAPDKGHIHHRLLAMGLTQRQVVISLYLTTAVVAAFAMFMVIARETGTILIFSSLVILLIGAFRSVGAVRLRETLSRVSERRAFAREIDREQQILHEAQLRLSEATTGQEWWKSLCLAAEELGFAEMTLVTDADPDKESLDYLRWRNRRRCMRPRTELTIPIRDYRSGLLARLKTRVFENGSLESVGRRIAILGRLVEAEEEAGSISRGRHKVSPGKSPTTDSSQSEFSSGPLSAGDPIAG